MLQLGLEPTLKVPLPSAKSPPVDVQEAPGPVNARTVKGTAPEGVAAVVVIVSVAVLLESPAAKASELGEKEAVAPVGKVVFTHRLAVKAPEEPGPVPRLTVTK